ncbi:MAG TPA: glycosyltransferase [Methylomirabilota bacterium]|jgi:glycosyltransferase involved in cell wall biosynthesis|nr:glycosyltransferase [Methylomirabilota bacterium]
MSARVAVLTPYAFPSVRGNAITVERIVRGLRGRGVDVRLWDLSAVPEAAVERELLRIRPTLIHAFHAFRVGPLALRLAREVDASLLVTITGTDGNHDLFDAERSGVVRQVLEAATGVTVFHESMTARLLQVLPDLAGRINVIPQSPVFESGDGLAARIAPRTSGATLLFPAGIRPVKNPRFPLAPLDGVAPRHPALQLWYVGPILDRDEGKALLEALRHRPWASYLGPRPHHLMRALYESAEVVLNCSLSEGGMANSVLEAFALGRAVLASDIEGNRSLVEDGVTGLVFGSPGEFSDKVDRLLRDPGLRRRLGSAGRELIAVRFSPARELDGYLAVYARMTPALRGA